MNPEYFSHIPLLTAAVSLTSGRVLELGSGLGSTLALHGICGAMNRELVTVESDEAWLNMFTVYGRPWHTLKHVTTFKGLTEYRQKWGLAFVDHGIAEERGMSIEALKDVPVIIAHDTCYPHLYNYEQVINSFKYRYDWKVKRPMTTALSNTVDVSFLFGKVAL